MQQSSHTARTRPNERTNLRTKKRETSNRGALTSTFISALALTAAIACTPSESPQGPTYIQDAFNPRDTNVVALHDLIMTQESRLEGFAQEEMPYHGPFVDEHGRTLITVRTTGSHAQQLAERWGFTVEGHRRLAQSASATLAAASACNLATVDINTKYLKDYNDIVAEFQVMDASSTAITAFSLGKTHTLDHEIIALQFGPTQPTPGRVPTVFLLGTHHAREWFTTGVTLGLARWLHDVVTNNRDPQMLALLQHAAIVVVPVANPDGYQWSRQNNANRA